MCKYRTISRALAALGLLTGVLVLGACRANEQAASPELFAQPPVIEKVDVLAAKLPQ